MPFINKILSHSDPQRRPASLRYGFALMLTAAAVWLRAMLVPIMGERSPMIVVLFAVLFASYYGGFGPGAVSTFLGGLGVLFFVILPNWEWTVLPGVQIQLAIFAAVGLLISTVNAALHRALRQAREQQGTARESQERVTEVLQSITEGYYFLDRELRIREMNLRACEFFGRSCEELVGRGFLEAFPMNAGTIFERTYRGAMETMQPAHFEAESRARPGCFAEVHVYPSERGVAVYFRDITERVKSEQAIAATARQLQLLTDAVPATLAQVDADLRYVFVNRANAALFALTPREMIGRPVREILGEEMYASLLPHFENAFRGTTAEFEFDLPRPEKAQHFRVSFLPVKDERDIVTDVVVLAVDVTDEKDAALEANRAATEKARLLEAEQIARAEAEAARAEAEEANRSKDQFLAALSHELRTPLTPVLLSASLYRKDQRLPEDVQVALEMIYRNMRLESRLIDDLLDLTRIAQKKVVMQREATDLHAVIVHAWEKCSANIPDDKKLEVGIALNATESAVWGDAARLEQVIWNLMSNAVKFTPDGGRINVRSFNAAPANITVEISDSGIGIPAELLPRIFDAFEQGGPRMTHRFGGLGLGLAITKTLVEIHHGTIKAASDGEGQGTTFTIAFETIALQPQKVDPPSAPLEPSGLRILLIEDHEHTAQVLERILGRKHAVRVANDCAGARHLLEKEKFDLLVSDVGLPDGNGFDLMREAREKYGAIGIAVSGFGMASDLEASREAGFVEHLIKPIDVSQLESAIGRVSAGVRLTRAPLPQKN